MVVEALGIRFAEAERFGPPRLVPWDGSLGTGSFGPACPQPPGEVFMTSGMRQDEDCLHLNVWTPSLDGRRPVLVWIHGGGYRQGSGDHFLSRGHVLAERGDVVVVTCNYRLGALGFAAHPDLGANAGLLDQQAALRWVAEHIADLGGDPGNVLLFGESAGAAAVAAHLQMPSSAGLFHRAAMQSGARLTVPADRAAAAVEELADRCGTTVAGLRTVPVDDLVAAQVAMEDDRKGAMRFLPATDGSLLADGAPYHPVPLLAGTNVDEAKLLGLRDPHRLDLDDDRLRTRLDPLLGDRAGDVVEAFRAARAERGEPVTPAELWFAIRTEVLFRHPTLAVADAHHEVAPVFTYLFEWRSPMLDGWLGAGHVVEIPFVFGLQGSGDLATLTGSGPEADRLGEQMMAAWVVFARGDDPWERHDPVTRPTRCFGADTRTELAPREPERAAVAAALAR